MKFSPENRRLLMLSLIALLLGGYTYITAPVQKTLNPEGPQQRPLFAFRSEQVSHIDILFDGKHVVGKRTPQGWQQPENGAPLPSAAVDEFLNNLVKLVHLGEVERGSEPYYEYGLEHPATKITVTVDGQGEQTLTLGKRNPVNTTYYAQLNDAPEIVLVGSIISWDLRKLMMALNGSSSG